MKKSPLKEFIISSIAAAVAGYVVKKGYEYFRDSEPQRASKKNTDKQGSLLDTSKNKVTELVDKVVDGNGNTAQQGLLATLAYSVVAFGVAKVLRKVV